MDAAGPRKCRTRTSVEGVRSGTSIRLVLVNIDIRLVLFNIAFGAFTDPRDNLLRL